ncbi:hypothetical protein [Alteromonas sp. ASW11-130]|uniref:hypothetical protein n=1 Tax=Alteromonas sp. ASW11-130 TaxID=3015775 RepID=UPI002241DDA0|nr:hypothetical protein [Alteromonas sp. ASW11-130]MCW8091548.1 hypothetical protein [Alteromonas sp. ASW11-130]
MKDSTKKPNRLNEYHNIHLWLMVPFAITLIGFYNSYWSDFSSAPLGWHFHALSATLWYLILIIQPYLIAKGNRKTHRTFGLLGLLIAGFVAASALAVVRGHIKDLDPAYDIIYAYRYSLSLTDFIYIAGFVFAIAMAVVERATIERHSRWMISTVFWVLSPATDRATFALMAWFDLHLAEWFDFEVQFLISHVFIISLLIGLMFFDRRKASRYWPPYMLVIVAHIVATFCLIYLKDSPWLAAWFESIYLSPFAE